MLIKMLIRSEIKNNETHLNKIIDNIYLIKLICTIFGRVLFVGQQSNNKCDTTRHDTTQMRWKYLRVISWKRLLTYRRYKNRNENEKWEGLSKKQARCFQTIPFHVPRLRINQATDIRVEKHAHRAHLPRGSTRITAARSIHFWWEFMFSPTAQNGSHRTATPWGNSTRGRRETRGNPRAWEKSAKV